jgi:hypothetical protein
MQVSGWRNGASKHSTYGIRVGKPNREAYFDPSWSTIQVDIEGTWHEFELTNGFWNDCPEFRGRAIRQWLERNHLLSWSRQKPPRAHLLPVDSNRFRLILNPD